jgi:hypothetical protein
MEGSFVGPKRHSSRPSTESCRQLGTWTSDELGPSLEFRYSLNPPPHAGSKVPGSRMPPKNAATIGADTGPRLRCLTPALPASSPIRRQRLRLHTYGIESSGGAEG